MITSTLQALSDTIPACVTSIESTHSLNKEILIYPNPSSGFAYVKFKKSISEEVTFDLFNTLGQNKFHKVVKSIHANEAISFELQDLLPGIYFININTGEPIGDF